MKQLTKRQTAAIEAIAKCDSISEASRECKVSRSTLHRWLNKPEFQQAMREARAKTHGVSLTRLCQASMEAVTTLIQGMRGEKISRIQYHCARSILEFAQGATAGDIEDRLDEIEALIAEATGAD